MKALLIKERPDLLVLVDSQGFNMPLAGFARSLGIKTCYYIPPQEWLWGTQRGVKKVIDCIDLILAIFENEYEVYRQAGGRVLYFGHPLLDIVKPTLSKVEARKKFFGIYAEPVISLCPGSRTQEINALLPILLRAATLIKRSLPDVRFLLPVASSWANEKINASLKYVPLPVKVVEGLNYDVLNCSDLVIAASGTINLESAILGVPNIMVYKLSWLSYFVGKYILGIEKKLKFFSMPNILLDEKIIPELTMGSANPEKIAFVSLRLLADKLSRDKMTSGFGRVRSKLGAPGVISRYASAIVDSFSLK
jgi:lipid-A-disaccharide synthase